MIRKTENRNTIKTFFLRCVIFIIFSLLVPEISPAEQKPPVLSPKTIGIAQFPSAQGDNAPSQNIPNLFDLISKGIENMFGENDIVAIKVTAGYTEQGYTNSFCLKALIEKILSRQGGFNGKIIIFDNTHEPAPDKQLKSGWAAEGNDKRHNGENLNSVIKSFQSTGKVYKITLEDVSINPDKWTVLKPDENGAVNLPEGKNGWIRYKVNIPQANRDVTLSVPVFRLPDGKIINLSANGGVYENGVKTEQQLKLIVAAPLSFHSRYAGVEGAVRAHLGLTELPGGADPKAGRFEDGSYNLHTLGYSDDNPQWVGTAVGIYIKKYLYPAVYMSFAEWSGFAGMFGAGTAQQTRVVGICADPVTLDYYMGKYFIYHADVKRLWNNPENDYAFGKTIKACNAQGVGTIDENEMTVLLYDADNPPTRVHGWELIQ